MENLGQSQRFGHNQDKYSKSYEPHINVAVI